MTVGQHRTKGTAAKIAQRQKVWEMYCSGMTKYRIAKIIGCHETNIGKMVNRMVEKYGQPDSQKARPSDLGGNTAG